MRKIKQNNNGNFSFPRIIFEVSYIYLSPQGSILGPLLMEKVYLVKALN